MTEKSFRDAYGVLQRHAQTLRDQDEPNIDDLLKIVTESVAAYGVCKERIDAVEAALKVALDGAGVGVSVASSAERVPSRTASPPVKAPPTSGFDDMDDDIPF